MLGDISFCFASTVHLHNFVAYSFAIAISFLQFNENKILLPTSRISIPQSFLRYHFCVIREYSPLLHRANHFPTPCIHTCLPSSKSPSREIIFGYRKRRSNNSPSSSPLRVPVPLPIHPEVPTIPGSLDSAELVYPTVSPNHELDTI